LDKIKRIEGYVADLPYPSFFNPDIQPAFLDAMLVAHCCLPPRETRETFTFIDLGCGDAASLLLMAASHPEGHFIGIDAMPEHINLAKQISHDAELKNIEFHLCTFAEAAEQISFQADYVISHGVLAWVSDENRKTLCNLASAWLKPGGAFYVSYNALPGWAPIMAFQRLLRSIANEQTGTSKERFVKGKELLSQMKIFDDESWKSFEDLLSQGHADYLAHEYLNDHWKPCWSGDVIATLQQHDLNFVCQANASKMRRDLYLSPEKHESLAKAKTVEAKEIAIDILDNIWFRKDIYIKGQPQFVPHEATLPARIESWWALARIIEPDAKYETELPSGNITFENECTKAIVTYLDDGPATLEALGQFSNVDLLNALDALLIAGWVVPVDPPTRSTNISKLNKALKKAKIQITGKATKFGAVAIQTLI
jgi:Predicted methyltransferase regulatory domain/Methyltransferase domain